MAKKKTKKKTVEKPVVFKFHFLVSDLVEHILYKQDKNKILELFDKKPKLKKEFITMIDDFTHDFITDALDEYTLIQEFGKKLQEIYGEIDD